MTNASTRIVDSIAGAAAIKGIDGGSRIEPYIDPRVGDFIALLKPRVMSLVVFTAFVGLYLAPGSLHPFLSGVAIFCIALGAGASGAINMWYDRDIDSQMIRTCERPIPAGRMAPSDALGFGVVMAVASVLIMGLAVNYVAASVLAFTILYYVFIYTAWLKRRTPQNIVIGGAAGAFPPMVGWAAVSGDISLYPLILFAIIFFWTPPHFWALALYRCGDYAKVGVPMLPVVAGARTTKRQMLAYTLLLLPLALLPSLMGYAGWVYGASAAVFGMAFFFHALRVFRADEVTNRAASDKAAKAMFGFSILYLFALFALLVVDRLLVGIV